MRNLLRGTRYLLLLPFRWVQTIFREVKEFLSEEPEDTPLGDSLEKAINNPESIFAHLGALRKHLLRAVLVLGLATIIAFAFASQIIDLLAYPVQGVATGKVLVGKVRLQAKLLQVLQDRRIERVGESTSTEVDARIIAATNRNLENEIRKGNFRQDLWYRLNVFPITVPPLRDRVEDIRLLVKHFVTKSR